MNASTNSLLKLAKRELTHALIYDTASGRWSCKCGYVLGDGHHALYAICPLSHRDKEVNARKAYHQTQISSAPVKKTALDLFNLAPEPQEEKPNAKKTKKAKRRTK